MQSARIMNLTKIIIFEMNDNIKGVQWHQLNHRLVIKLNPKNYVAKLLGKVGQTRDEIIIVTPNDANGEENPRTNISSFGKKEQMCLSIS